MESTVGLVCDPDEFEVVEKRGAMIERITSDENNGFNSLRVEVSKQTGREEKLGIMTGSEPYIINEDIEFLESQKVFEDEDDEILSFIECKVNEHISQALTLSWSSDGNKNYEEKPLQATLTFEAGDSQNWGFTQPRSTVEIQQTQDSQMLDLSQSSSVYIKQEDTNSTISLYREISEIPASIRNLYSSIAERYSDYCFSYMLAAQLCQEEIPMSTYNELKLSLLLSIASVQKTNQSHPFHVMVLGADTSISHLAMTSIGQLARRFMAGMFDPLAGGRVLEDNFVECGATTLARTGICYIGDWAMQKPSNSARILREIESEQVIIENHPITYPLECAIWGCWNYTKKAKQDLNTIIMFLNTFGIPIVQPEQAPDAVMDFILEKPLVGYEADHEQVLIPEEDIRQFLAILFYQQVQISEPASKLLSDYFVATRVNVPESLTQTSFSALHKLTEAHARLCFRSEATRIDAVVAIMICERFIHAIFSNPGNAAPLSDSFETIDDLEQHFNCFDRWLKDFLRDINRV